MSAEYKNTDPLSVAKQAEQDLGSDAARKGHDASLKAGHGMGASTSTTESGVDDNVEKKFPGAEVTYGSAASGAGSNRDMPEGGVNASTGQPLKAGDFERGGVGAPEARDAAYAKNHGGEQDAPANVK